MKRFLLFAVMGLFATCAHAQTTVTFTGIAPGTVLGTQFEAQGVRFVPQDGVGATVFDHAGTPVARFDNCLAVSGCEFGASRGHIVFTNPQASVALHVGITSEIKGVRATVRFAAVDSDQNAVASVTKTLRLVDGLQTEVSLQSPSAAPVIFGVVFQITNLPTMNAAVLLRDIVLPAPGPAVPDFQVLPLAPVTLLTKGAAVDVQVVVVRTGSSSGGIQLSFPGSIPGVDVQFPQNPFLGDTAVIRLQATANTPPHHFIANFTLAPAVASAGSSAHTAVLGIEIADPLRILGPSVVDAANCAADPDGANGTLTIPIQVLRYWSIAAPVGVGVFSNNPSLNIEGSPAVLQFPGNVLLDTALIKVHLVTGVEIPSTVLTINAGNRVVQTSALFLIHGTCPRRSQNFVASGSFSCNDRGTVSPVRFARVDLFRSVDFWFDEWYGSTVTDDSGRYNFLVQTGTKGDYYARLRLVGSKQPVSLRDSWSDDPWTLGTDSQPNLTGHLDFGEIQISRNGGTSTPKCAIFEGGRFAFEDEAKTLQLFGAVPPQPHYDLAIWRGFISPISYRLNTDWPDKYPTIAEGWVSKPTGNPKLALKDFNSSLHEFGHTYRHYLDGGTDHFNHDSTVYFYGRSHDYCDFTNPGFAFNEGWAEYWSMEPILRATAPRGDPLGPCQFQPIVTGSGPIGVDESTSLLFQIEGLVAEDLQDLETCTGIGRAGMARVLMTAGPEAIHSETTFRQQLASQFPSADPSKCTAVADAVKNSAVVARSPLVSSVEEFRAQRAVEIQRDIAALENSIRRLDSSLRESSARGLPHRSCTPRTCESVFLSSIRPAVLQGQQEFARLMAEELRHQLSRLGSDDPWAAAYDPSAQFEERARTIDFDSRRREIVHKTMLQALALAKAAMKLDPGLAKTSAFAELQRRLKMLETSSIVDDGTLHLVRLPASLDDDLAGVVAKPSRKRP